RRVGTLQELLCRYEEREERLRRALNKLRDMVRGIRGDSDSVSLTGIEEGIRRLQESVGSDEVMVRAVLPGWGPSDPDTSGDTSPDDTPTVYPLSRAGTLHQKAVTVIDGLEELRGRISAIVGSGSSGNDMATATTVALRTYIGQEASQWTQTLSPPRSLERYTHEYLTEIIGNILSANPQTDLAQAIWYEIKNEDDTTAIMSKATFKVTRQGDAEEHVGYEWTYCTTTGGKPRTAYEWTIDETKNQVPYSRIAGANEREIQRMQTFETQAGTHTMTEIIMVAVSDGHTGEMKQMKEAVWEGSYGGGTVSQIFGYLLSEEDWESPVSYTRRRVIAAVPVAQSDTVPV
ncbi:MAG: hypothetical protein LBR78_00125, partial [Holosporales bacterium]|nr:hypothetical protein [Holosporales bacterium]